MNEVKRPTPRPRHPRKGEKTGLPRHAVRPDVISTAQGALRELVRTSGLFRGLAESHFATYGVSLTQWSVLRALARLERGGPSALRVHELCAEVVVGAPSLSATLERMERSGLVARTEDPGDKRAKNVRLAPAGRHLLDRKITDHMLWIEGLMAGLTRREQAVLSRLLAKAGSHMRDLSEAHHRSSPYSKSLSTPSLARQQSQGNSV